MKFWDSSALIPLLVEEETTVPLRDLYLVEEGAIVWWGASVECASAVCRLEREERLSPEAVTEALERLDALARSWHRIEPVDEILESARRFSGSIRCVLPTPFSWQRPFSRRKVGPRPSSSCALTTGCRSRRSARDSW